MRRTTVAAVFALSLAATLATSPAQAGAADPGIDARQARQALRIEHGVASGALTAREARRLAAEQRAIRLEERAYRSDGRLTRWERADLARDQNAASRHIYREAHDAQVRR